MRRRERRSSDEATISAFVASRPMQRVTQQGSNLCVGTSRCRLLIGLAARAVGPRRWVECCPRALMIRIRSLRCASRAHTFFSGCVFKERERDRRRGRGARIIKVGSNMCAPRSK